MSVVLGMSARRMFTRVGESVRKEAQKINWKGVGKKVVEHAGETAGQDVVEDTTGITPRSKAPGSATEVVGVATGMTATYIRRHDTSRVGIEAEVHDRVLAATSDFHSPIQFAAAIEQAGVPSDDALAYARDIAWQDFAQIPDHRLRMLVSSLRTKQRQPRS